MRETSPTFCSHSLVRFTMADGEKQSSSFTQYKMAQGPGLWYTLGGKKSLQMDTK